MRTQRLHSLLLGGAFAIATLATFGAGAQETAPPPGRPAGAPPETTVFVGGPGALPLPPLKGAVNIVAAEARVLGKVVTDKPYSADSVTEMTQVLADGNRIVNKNEARIYRDSAGRTRREQTLSAMGAWPPGDAPVTMITIDDPVAKVSYFLDPQTQTARELRPYRFQTQAGAPQDAAGEKGPVALAPGDAAPAPGGVVPAPGGVALAPGGNVFFRLERRAPAPGAGPASGVEAGEAVGVEAGQASGVEAGEASGVEAGEASGGETGEAFGGETGGAAAPPLTSLPPPRMAFGVVTSRAADPGNTRKEDLGDQVIQGMLAHGTRYTQTIPAGAIGNELPIDVVSESWYSDEIEDVVMSRTSDPRFGETIYQLENVVREEPSPDLFAVPQGYKLLTEDARVTPGQGPATRGLFNSRPRP